MPLNRKLSCNSRLRLPLILSSIVLRLFLYPNIPMTPPMTGQGMGRKPSSDSVSSSVSRLMHLDHHQHLSGGSNSGTNTNKSGSHPSNNDSRRTSNGRTDNLSPHLAPYSVGPGSGPGRTDDHTLAQGNRGNAYPHLSQPQHPLDNSTPLLATGVAGVHLSTPTNSSTPRRKNNSKDGIESGLRAFFRSSSRPPSPDLADSNAHVHSSIHTNANPSHTRKTSFGSNRNVSLTGSMGSLLSYGGGPQTTSSGNHLSSTSSSSNQLQQIQGHNQQYQRPQHPFSPDMGRRRSTESYSRSPSPDPNGASLQQQPRPIQYQYQVQGHDQQYQQQTAQSSSVARRHVLPNTPPSQPRLHQRTNSIKSSKPPVSHRRTKSTDFGEMFTKRPVLQEPEHHASHMASPAKEAKKIILGLFKKKNSSSSSNIGSSSNVLSHQTSHQPDGKNRFASANNLQSISDPLLIIPTK